MESFGAGGEVAVGRNILPVLNTTSLAKDVDLLAKFRLITGFGDTEVPQVVPSKQENAVASPAAATPRVNAGASEEGTPLVSDPFPGFKHPSDPIHASGRRRIYKYFRKLLQNIKDYNYDVHVSSSDSPVNTAMCSIAELGLVRASADVVVRQVGKRGLGELPRIHSGVTSWEHACCYVNLVPSEAFAKSVPRNVIRQNFLTYVTLSLAREKGVPLYVTDLQTQAMKVYVGSVVRKLFPIVYYDLMSIDEFQKDLIRTLRKPNTAKFTEMEAANLKSSWMCGGYRTNMTKASSKKQTAAHISRPAADGGTTTGDATPAGGSSQKTVKAKPKPRSRAAPASEAQPTSAPVVDGKEELPNVNGVVSPEKKQKKRKDEVKHDRSPEKRQKKETPVIEMPQSPMEEEDNESHVVFSLSDDEQKTMIMRKTSGYSTASLGNLSADDLSD